jgi:hypothetical protein
MSIVRYSGIVTGRLLGTCLALALIGGFCQLVDPAAAQSGKAGSPSMSGDYRVYDGEWALRILHKFGYAWLGNDGLYYATPQLVSFLASKHSETAPGPRGLMGIASKWHGDPNQPLPFDTAILLPNRGHDWHPVPSMCIPGHNISHYGQVSVNQCKDLCLDNPDCKSIDYKPATNECWLQDVDDTSGLLEHCQGIYNHYSLGF